MSFRFGRVVLATEPYLWDSRNSDSVTVRGSYVSTGLTDGLVKRDQLLGYPNDDEPVVPVILDSEPRVNGFYRPVSVSVATDLFTRLKGNLYDYQIEMQRISSFAQPMLESIVTGALLTNVVGAVAGDAQPFHSVPAATLQYRNTLTNPSFNNRASADGSLQFQHQTIAPGNFTAQFSLSPANYYIGAATFEQGSPLQTVMGTSLVQTDLVNWRLSNGLVRVTPNASLSQLDFSHYNGSTWSAVKTFSFVPAWNSYGALASLTVLRNSPEEVIIRLSYGLTTTNILITLDFALRRGDRIVRVYGTTTLLATWIVARATAEAATAITFAAVTAGGIRATANDSDGNRYVLLSYQQAVTSDLVNGKLTTTAPVKTADFGIGSEVGGSGALFGTDDAPTLARQYLAALSEAQRAVTR